jgi:hypothetical protein
MPQNNSFGWASNSTPIDSTPAGLPRPPDSLIEAAANAVPSIMANVAPGPDERISLVASVLTVAIHKQGHTVQAACWAVHRLVCEKKLSTDRAYDPLPIVPGVSEGGYSVRPVPRGEPTPFGAFRVVATESLWKWWREIEAGKESAPMPSKTNGIATRYTLGDLLFDLRNYDATVILAQQASEQCKDPVPQHLKGLAPHQVDSQGFYNYHAIRAAGYHHDSGRIWQELETKATKPAFDQLKTFCRAREKPFTADSLEMLIAQAAERIGKTLGELLEFEVAAGIELLANPKSRSESASPMSTDSHPTKGKQHINQARSWLQARFLGAPERTKAHDVIRVYEPGGVSGPAKEDERYFLAIPRQEFHDYLLSIGAPVAETIRLCQDAEWITLNGHIHHSIVFQTSNDLVLWNPKHKVEIERQVSLAYPICTAERDKVVGRKCSNLQ